MDELSIVALSMVAPYKWIFVIEVIDVGIQSRAAPLLVDIIMISFFVASRLPEAVLYIWSIFESVSITRNIFEIVETLAKAMKN